MTSRRTWTDDRQDWLEDSFEGVQPRRLYPDIIAAESTFSSINSKELTVDFSKEEYDFDIEENDIKLIEENVYSRRSQSRLAACDDQNRSSSKRSSPSTSVLSEKRKFHSETFRETHDSVTTYFDAFVEYIGDFINLLVAAILVLLVGFLLYWMLWPASSQKNRLSPKLLDDINAVAQSEFDGDRRVRSVLKYIFEVLFQTEFKSPVVVLLVGQEHLTNRFLRPLQQLLVNHCHYALLDITIPADGSSTRRNLEQNLNNFLGADGANRVVFMRAIDRLPGTTPLLLHAMCDPDTAPHKNLLLIGTLSPPDLPMSVVDKNDNRTKSIQRRECDEHVSNYLLNAWSYLKPDKTYPVISRISAILLCLV